jgi:hypothetical protein
MKGWQRYSIGGVAITPEQAHPGAGGTKLPAIGTGLMLFHLWTLKPCREGTVAQCMCAQQVEMLGGDPNICIENPICRDKCEA